MDQHLGEGQWVCMSGYPNFYHSTTEHGSRIFSPWDTELVLPKLAKSSSWRSHLRQLPDKEWGDKPLQTFMTQLPQVMFFPDRKQLSYTLSYFLTFALVTESVFPYTFPYFIHVNWESFPLRHSGNSLLLQKEN